MAHDLHAPAGEDAREDAAGTAPAAFPNNLRKFAVVRRATSSSDICRVAASILAVSTTWAGSLRFPRWGSGAR